MARPPIDPFKKLYPFEPHYFAVDGQRLHYVDEGRGPAVVLLHGNPTWSFFYRDLIKALSANHRVIALDHLGCGLSDKPLTYDYCLRRHVDNTVAVLDHLGLTKFHLVCHDWGGPIGLGAVVRRPARLNRLVLLNTTMELGRPYPWRIRLCHLPLLGAWLIRGLSYFALGATYMATVKGMAPEVRKGFIKPYDSWEHRVANLRFVQDIPVNPSHRTWAVGEEILSQASKIKDRPVMLCWGMKDFCFTPAFLAGCKALFPQAEVHEFPQAGHYVLEDAGAEIIPLVQQFLAPVAGE